MNENEQTWQIVIERRVKRVFRRLPKDLLDRIKVAIKQLAQNPRPVGSKKLTGYQDLYRIRVGQWRIVYAIEEEELIILVIEVSPRGGAYKNL